jgi:hypothetical protein
MNDYIPEYCTKCGEAFLPLDITLFYQGKRTHYCFCKRWTPPAKS